MPSSGARSTTRRAGAIRHDVRGAATQASRPDGALTAPSSQSPASVVQGFVSRHPEVFRLRASEAASLVL